MSPTYGPRRYVQPPKPPGYGGKPYVRRRDITVAERVEQADRYPHEGPTFTTTWCAELAGKLSSGEHVGLERSGATFPKALASLEIAITDNGWEIK